MTTSLPPEVPGASEPATRAPLTHIRAPLTDVVVLEVSVFMAGPFAGMQLADLGATVFKVENPRGGDPLRAAGPVVAGHGIPFAHVNRNKRSVALDLKAPRGREAFLRLADRADVIIENLRPGTMRSLGLGYEQVRARNPRIIYASASGWGQDGPLAHLPGLDIMAQARSGLMSVTGPEGGPPVKVGIPICDLTCGLYVALAVVAAMRAREQTGEGQYLDVSLYESGVALAIWEAARYFTRGEAGQPLGSAHQSLAPYQNVRTADGHLTLGAVTPATWAALCRVLGFAELLGEERYADASLRHAYRAELIATIEEKTVRWTTADLVEALEQAGVPCAPLANYAQVFCDEHLVRRGFFWDAPHPSLGTVRQLGSPMRMSASPTVRKTAGPELGAHTRDALRHAGYDNSVIDDLIANGIAAEPS